MCSGPIDSAPIMVENARTKKINSRVVSARHSIFFVVAQPLLCLLLSSPERNRNKKEMTSRPLVETGDLPEPPDMSWPTANRLRKKARIYFGIFVFALVVLFISPSSNTIGSWVGYKGDALVTFARISMTHRIYHILFISFGLAFYGLCLMIPGLWFFRSVENGRDCFVVFVVTVVTILFAVVLSFEICISLVNLCGSQCFALSKSLAGMLVDAWLVAAVCSYSSLLKYPLYLEKIIRMGKYSESALNPLVYPIETDLAYFSKKL